MKAAVVIPWVDSGCPWRRRNLGFVTRYWRQLNIEMLVIGSKPFSRAAAINAGVKSVNANIILQSDPDSFVSRAAARQALADAALAPGLVVPHTRYRYLTEAATDAVVDDDPRDVSWEAAALYPVEFEGEHGVGNVVCFSRETWKLAGGYDERYGTWGSDDGAFAIATGTLVAEQRRLTGDVIHLWHPRLPESDPAHPEYQRALALFREYERRSGDPAAMRAFVDSRDEATGE